MRAAAITALTLSVVALVLLGILPADSGWHTTAAIALCALAVLAAGFAIVGELRRTPKDRIGVGAGVGALVGAVGVVGTVAYMSSTTGAGADIGIGAAFLLSLVLLLSFGGVAAIRAR